MISNNALGNIFVGQLVNTLAGPSVTSMVFDPTTLTYMTVYEWEVFNGALLVEPLAFGMFAEIKPMNMSKSKLTVRVAPGFSATSGEISAPIFQELCAEDRSLNAQLISSIVCRQVVPLATPADKGPGIWDSVVEAIDSTHGMKTTRHDPVIFQQRGFTVTRETTVPPRFRAKQGTRETTEVIPGPAGLPLLVTGDELRSEQQQTVNTKQVTTRTRNDTNDVQLDGSVAYEEGVKADVSETLVDVEPVADTGLQVISSEVTDYGNGQWGKTTHTAPTWPVFKGSKVDEQLNAPVGYTEEFVTPPGSTTSARNVEYEPINADRTLKRTIEVPVGYYESYHDSYPVRVNLRLPKVLKSVSVVWNLASEEGQQASGMLGESYGKSYSLSCNLADGSSSSAAAIPEILVELEDFWGENLPATGHIVFMALPITEAQILAKFGAMRWPVFKPRSHTIVGCGQKVGCAVKVSVSASASGSETNVSKDAGKTLSSDKDVSLTNNVVQINDVIHPTMAISGTLTQLLTVRAEGHMQVAGANFPSMGADLVDTVSARAFVSPISLPASRGATTIPTSGVYLIDSHVEPYKHGYAKVYAEIFNAAVLA